MVVYTAQAITRSLSRKLHISPEEPIAHRDLEHAHWDRDGRRWYTHPDAHDDGEAAPRAA